MRLYVINIIVASVAIAKMVMDVVITVIISINVNNVVIVIQYLKDKIIKDNDVNLIALSIKKIILNATFFFKKKRSPKKNITHLL